MIKISSITIAKNEAENIERCLASLQNCVDEIILLIDSSTTDSTREIAEKIPNVKIIITEWLGYARTKQFAVSAAANDWVFWIDADEVITEELQSELLEFKNKISDYDCFEVARRAYFLGRWIKHSGWYPSRVIRLFNKHKVKFNENEVHESLTGYSNVGQLQNDLLHFTDKNINHYYEKFNRYTTLAANDLYAKRKQVTLNDLLFRPLFLFFKMYIFRLGFLDGIEGLMLAIFSSNYVFTKYCKLRELNNKRKI